MNGYNNYGKEAYERNMMFHGDGRYEALTPFFNKDKAPKKRRFSLFFRKK